jgi:hypothetical protein
MKLGLGCCLLVTLGLVSCGGTTGSATLSGNNPAAIKTAPAGVSTLVFMDLELIRPDNLTGQTALPAGVTSILVPFDAPRFTPQIGSGIEVLTFTNVKAADGGLINGTIDVAWTTLAGVTTYVETFNLTVATGTAGQSWAYTGTQQVAVTAAANTAVVTIPPSITAAYTDTNTPANNKTYAVTILNPLTVDWSNANAISLSGQYQLAVAGVETIQVTLAPSLMWNSSVPCFYPFSGTLTLDLNSVATGTDSTTVVFSSTCGQVTIGGVNFNLGQ